MPTNNNKNRSSSSSSNNNTGETKPLMEDSLNQHAADFALDYLEEQRRQRVCLALAMFCIIFVFVGAIAVWNRHLQEQSRAETAAIEQSMSALDKLNEQAPDVGNNIPRGCETTLVLMRHCEKYGPSVIDAESNEHCSYLGYERSFFLPTLFGHDDTSRWPLPAHLFALTVDRGEHRNFREYETLLPLSRKAGVVTELIRRHGFASEYFDLLQTGDLCGKVAVVSWKHEFMAELAATLGCGPDNGCPQNYNPDEFDELWLLKYVYYPPLANHYSNMDEFEESGAGDSDSNGNKGRRLKKKSRHDRKNRKWFVYGSVVKQGFDPLAFSKQSGDYPAGGTPSGGAWRSKTIGDEF